jgi:hypothetical protein
MPSDRSEAFVLTLRTPGGRAQRLELEPRTDGYYDKTERVLLKGGDWHVSNDIEIVETVTVENLSTVASSSPALREHLEAAYRHGQSQSAREELREALQLLDAIEEGL